MFADDRRGLHSVLAIQTFAPTEVVRPLVAEKPVANRHRQQLMGTELDHSCLGGRCHSEIDDQKGCLLKSVSEAG